MGGADPVAGTGDSGGLGSVAIGLIWEAGSGIVKDSLGGSGNSDVGEWPRAARANADDANRVPTGLGAGCPMAR